MNKFKVNDLVKVYGSSQISEECHDGVKGLVIGLVKGGDWVNVYIENFCTRTFHSKQLRRLKPKAKPEPRKAREFVLYENGVWREVSPEVIYTTTRAIEKLPDQVLVSRKELAKAWDESQGRNTTDVPYWFNRFLKALGLSEKGGE